MDTKDNRTEQQGWRWENQLGRIYGNEYKYTWQGSVQKLHIFIP